MTILPNPDGPPVTERLYYTDPYLTDFAATIVEVRRIGERTAVVLDRTAFYPTSGGQPFDTGTLAGARVVDVVHAMDVSDGMDDMDGMAAAGDAILHVIEGETPQGLVEGRIDWDRRFDHMQQHTGQHVLSAAFDALLQVRTTSFHLGSAVSTIDLAREVTAAEIARAEDAANRVIWEDRPVTVRFVEAEDAAALPLRKQPVRTGRLRIIEVEGHDVSACGGTHVARTGAIGVIVVSAWERFRGGSRLEFRCGGRASAAYRVLRDAMRAATALVPVAAADLAAGIERLQGENRELKKRLKDVDGRLATFDAQALLARAVLCGSTRVVAESLEGDAGRLKTIAQEIAAHPGYAAVLCSTSPPLALVVARSAETPIDAAALLKGVMARFGGKGGGRPELAQGGGIDAAPREVLDAALGSLR